MNAALVAAYYEKDMMATPYNPIVVNTGEKLVLIDTGTGEAAFNTSKGATGQFLINLAAAGIDPKAIDTVVISHYHGDHVNGLLKADNSLAYPNAEILVPAAEHQLLHGRRRDEPRAQGPHGDRVQERAPRVRRRGAQAA